LSIASAQRCSLLPALSVALGPEAGYFACLARIASASIARAEHAVTDTAPASSNLSRWLMRLLLFALVWLLLVGTDPLSWLVGVPSVLLATVAAARLSTLVGADPRPLRLLAFVPFFVWESILGGLDVARRVLGPRLLIDPVLVTYRPRLQDAAARVVFLDSISLLPGTLSADFRDDLAYVHALDGAAPIVEGLERLERRVAGLFGERLTGAPEVSQQPCPPGDSLALARAAAATRSGGENA
jgi:multicomponent Na+:H+ antiporter subunit E